MAVYPLSFVKDAFSKFREEKNQGLKDARAQFFYCCGQYYQETHPIAPGASRHESKRIKYNAKAIQNDFYLKQTKELDRLFGDQIPPRLQESAINLQKQWKSLKKDLDSWMPIFDSTLNRRLERLIQANGDFTKAFIKNAKSFGKDTCPGGSLLFPKTLKFFSHFLFERWAANPGHLKEELEAFETSDDLLIASIPFLIVLKTISTDGDCEIPELFSSISEEILLWKEEFKDLSEEEKQLLWSAGPLSREAEIDIEWTHRSGKLFKQIREGIYKCDSADSTAFRGFFSALMLRVVSRAELAIKLAESPALQEISNDLNPEEIFIFLKQSSPADYASFRQGSGFIACPARQKDLRVDHVANPRYLEKIQDTIALAKALQSFPGN